MTTPQITPNTAHSTEASGALTGNGRWNNHDVPHEWKQVDEHGRTLLRSPS